MMHEHGTKKTGGCEVDWVCHQNGANSIDSINQSPKLSENGSSPSRAQSLRCSKHVFESCESSCENNRGDGPQTTANLSRTTEARTCSICCWEASTIGENPKFT